VSRLWVHIFRGGEGGMQAGCEHGAVGARHDAGQREESRGRRG